MARQPATRRHCAYHQHPGTMAVTRGQEIQPMNRLTHSHTVSCTEPFQFTVLTGGTGGNAQSSQIASTYWNPRKFYCDIFGVQRYVCSLSHFDGCLWSHTDRIHNTYVVRIISPHFPPVSLHCAAQFTVPNPNLPPPPL